MEWYPDSLLTYGSAEKAVRVAREAWQAANNYRKATTQQ
jgi:hypothetical protein